MEAKREMRWKGYEAALKKKKKKGKSLQHGRKRDKVQTIKKKDSNQI